VESLSVAERTVAVHLTRAELDALVVAVLLGTALGNPALDSARDKIADASVEIRMPR
jgi:hypothetical protein